jgi:predicted ATPase/class 3 adenylate cyclase
MRHDLPTGTVTFLFTDIEGSTRVLESLGAEPYAEALLAHRQVVRSALTAHAGTEVDTQGDAFFCAFADAAKAVACADEIRSRLAETPIRLRMGIHTGEAHVVDDHYVGLDVHRAARIGGCGHGGQVVLSPTTVALLEQGVFDVRDLGEHRLKDLSAPLRLHQLGDDDFPPLNTLFRTDLPVPATEFLGREEELAEAAALARRPGVRLLTLTGPGGTGKTRFALQLAGELGDEFPHGVRWVPLASLREGALVASALAETLGVEEKPGEPLVSAITETLGGKRILLLVDNCEHLVDAVAEVLAPVLPASPSLLVLTTSREAIGIAGEHVYAVRPLSSTDAVSLFETRAAAAGAALEPSGNGVVAALCARLDNLPLAVELAAARAPALPPATMLTALSERLDLLKGPRDADERHRTIRGAIAWSHDLLEPGEQRLFRRLSVFTGGAPLESVEEVCKGELDDLLSLVAKSLVRAQADARYWMLETIREFATSLLDVEEGAECRQRHLTWFAALARKSRDRLEGPGSKAVLDRLESERENLRSALAWALEVCERESALTLCSVLGPLHRLHGRYAEAENVLRTALALEPTPIDAALLYAQLGRVLRHRGESREGLEAHFAAERALGAPPADGDAPWWRAWIEVKLEQAHHQYFVADLDALAAVIEELRPHAGARGTPTQGLDFLHVVAQAAYRRERYELSEETEALVREIYRRGKEVEEVDAEFSLGFCLLWRGKLEDAARHLAAGREAATERGDALIETRCFIYEAVARRRLDDVEGVRVLLAELDELEELHGYAGLLAANHVWVSGRDGDHKAVRQFAAAAFADWDPAGRSGPTVFQWTARFPLLAVELAEGRVVPAFEQGSAMLDPLQQPLLPELGEALRIALERREVAFLERAVELARPLGYA